MKTWKPQKFIDLRIKNFPAARIVDLKKIAEERRKLQMFSIADEALLGKKFISSDIKPQESEPKEKKEKEERQRVKAGNLSLNFLRPAIPNPDRIKARKSFSEVFIWPASFLVLILRRIGSFFGLFSTFARLAMKQIVLKKKILPFVFTCFIFFGSIKIFSSFFVRAQEVKHRILASSGVAVQYMKSATLSAAEKDFSLAAYKFGIAQERFIEAKKELDSLSFAFSTLLKILPASEVSSAYHLLSVGADLATVSGILSEVAEDFSRTGDIFEDLRMAALRKDGQETKDIENTQTITSVLASSQSKIESALASMVRAEKEIKKVNTKSLPSGIAKKVAIFQESIPKIKESLDYFLNYSDFVFEVLGGNESKKYLILFENDRELRPTGGFIGTYGLLDISDGRIKNLKIEGPYNIDGQLKEKYIAPEPLRLINPNFYMRDANWFLDFPTSSKKILSLYEKSGGATCDGVLAISAKVLEELLKITGPVEMPEYEAVISFENFYDQTQKEVEYEYDRQLNEPKKFIADLFPKIIEQLSFKVKEDGQMKKLTDIFFKMLNQKNILVYFTNDELEAKVRDLGYSGEILKSNKDFLSVVSINIGGGKTDHVIDQKVYHQINVSSEGFLEDTLTVTREHLGSLADLWTSVKNLSYLKVYVPEGSELISAEGFDEEFFDQLIMPDEDSVPDSLIHEIESSQQIDKKSQTRITHETGKTVFGNWIGTEVGEKKTVVLKYKLPFRLTHGLFDSAKSYQLTIQKQPGVDSVDFESVLVLPKGFKIYGKFSSDNLVSEDLGRIKYKTKLDTDKVYGVVFGE